VLGNLIRLHHSGMVTMPGNSRRELATTWEHYWFAPDGSYGTAQRAVAHDFWVSIFFIFFITLSVLMCFLLYILFCSNIFDCPRRATTRRTHWRSSTLLLKRSADGSYHFLGNFCRPGKVDGSYLTSVGADGS
jgi:hypothetical protein